MRKPEELTDSARMESIECPFCKEKDYDSTGLALHLLQNQCDVAESLVSAYRATQREEFERRRAAYLQQKSECTGTLQGEVR